MNGYTKGEAILAPDSGSADWADACGAPPAASPAEPELSFELVYDRHFEFAWRSLRALGVRREALEDAVQDVFGVVSRRLCDFEGRSSLRTWVFGIVQNVASNHRRRRARKSDRLEPLHEDLPGDAPTPQAHAEAGELAALVLRFSEELEETWRAVFVLGVLERMPAAEIAASLGIPINTVYSRVHTLRKEIEARITQHEVDP